MSKKPTEKQINEEIKKLTEMKPYVRRRTLFGDDNHEGIDAQIKVLMKPMDNDEIFDEWPEQGEHDDDSDSDVDENESVRDHALQAFEWLEGESEESLSESWAPLDSRNSEKIQ